MKRIDIEFSEKNIPMTDIWNYKRILLSEIEKFNHNLSFRNRSLEQKCTLKDVVWNLKDRNKQFSIKWSILRYSKCYRPGDKICRLCLDEKIAIFDIWGKTSTINKDKMIMRPCDHKYEFNITRCKDL